jgi:hypothetical protein
MDLNSIVRLTLRHWRVTVPAAVATVLLVVAAVVLASPTYSASASVAMFSPAEPPSDEAATGVVAPPSQNPFSRYGDLSVVADIVARKMDGEAVRAALKEKGVAGYEVVANRIQRGPIVEVTGTGPNPEAAISSAEAVVAEFNAVLLDMQVSEGADPNYTITSAPIESPETAVAQVGSTMRVVIAAIAVGGLGTLGLAVAAEAFTRRRAAGTHSSGTSAPDPAAGPGPRSADDRLKPLVGTGRIIAPPVRDPAHAHTRAPSGAARIATNVYRPAGSVPAADRPDGDQNDWDRWSASAGTFAPENGHKQPTTDKRP